MQRLKAKQQTVICCGRMPNYPGDEPVDVEEHRRWKPAADKFARYMLTVFRPEIDLYQRGQTNTLTYDWAALKAFVHDLQASSSLLLKLQLSAMHTMIHSMATTFKSKVMLSQYQSKNRTLWSEDDKSQFDYEAALAGQSRYRDSSVLDEMQYQQMHLMLLKKSITEIKKQIAYCNSQQETIDGIYQDFDRRTNSRNDATAEQSAMMNNRREADADILFTGMRNQSIVQRYDEMIHQSNVLESDTIFDDAEDAQQATTNTTCHLGVER